MTHNIHLKSLITLLSACWLCVASAHAEVSTRLSSRSLARGERALLQVAIVGNRPTETPSFPKIKGVELKWTGIGPETRLLPGRRLEHVFEYLVSSYEVGRHTIPSISVEGNGRTYQTQPLEFDIFNPEELEWSRAEAGETTFRYASMFRVLDDQPFQDEAIPVEIKIYVPRDLFVVDWGIPDYERDGLTAWRFEPSEMKGQATLLGMPYISVAYPSSLSPSRTGEVAIGPAKIRLITNQVIMDGILRRVAVETNLSVPQLKLKSQPLPEGAPDGFENAIGNFEIEVTTPETNVQEGDPIPIEIAVTGTGNLNTLLPPTPIKSSGWKLYEPSSAERGGNRRELTGTKVFNQFIRPLELKGEIPPFRLVYFDPVSENYKTAVTRPIQLDMIPAANTTQGNIAPPVSANIPVEEMTDILGLIPKPVTGYSNGLSLPSWWIHVTGGALALLLVLKALWMRIAPRLKRNPDALKREKELRNVEQTTASGRDFLMAAGRYIERWHGDNPSEDIRNILKERDQLCFQPEGQPAPELPKNRRSQILKTLRKATIAVILTLFACLGNQTLANDASDADSLAREAYQSARYQEAIQIWMESKPYDELSADTLYHIGNACYRAGSAGNAALYYRRALVRDPDHEESRQNLRFIERKYGALTIDRPDYQYAITRIPLTVWQQVTWAGVWLTLLALLTFPATRYSANIRVLAVIALIIGPMIALSSGLGWRYYPRDTEFTPLNQQAVVTAQKQHLYTDASRTSTEVIEAPVGSLCEVIHQSGSWSYVAFASKTRGWVPTEAIEKVIPDQTPAPPKIEKPKASDNNA